MKSSLLALALVTWTIAGPALAAERTVTLTVENMTCASCPFIVKESLLAVPGVKTVEITLETNSATVVFEDAETNNDALTNATTNAGYPSQVKS